MQVDVGAVPVWGDIVVNQKAQVNEQFRLPLKYKIAIVMKYMYLYFHIVNLSEFGEIVPGYNI